MTNFQLQVPILKIEHYVKNSLSYIYLQDTKENCHPNTHYIIMKNAFQFPSFSSKSQVDEAEGF